MIPGHEDEMRNLIESHIPPGDGECIELGCHPGRFLVVAGELGYRLHGVDLARTTENIAGWLSSHGFRTGQFYQEDFLTFVFPQRFDAVFSLGVIEHLSNWYEAVAMHAALLKDGGHLLIGAPNFSGLLQRVFHKYLDLDSFNGHYIPSMNSESWKDILELLGLEVTYCGTPFPFNWDIHPAYANKFPHKAVILQAVNAITPLLRNELKIAGPHVSHYHVVAARKTQSCNVRDIMETTEYKTKMESIVAEAMERDKLIADVSDAVINALETCAVSLMELGRTGKV